MKIDWDKCTVGPWRKIPLGALTCANDDDTSCVYVLGYITKVNHKTKTITISNKPPRKKKK